MMYFSGTRNRRPYLTCRHCGGPAPLDAIRLRGGIRYCLRDDCRRVAEQLIRAARERLERTSEAAV